MPAKSKIAIAFFLTVIAAGTTGWFWGKANQAQINSVQFPVREGGYKLANPLLVCARDETSTVDQNVQTAIQNTVQTETKNGHVLTASVYYRRFLDNSWALLNGDETYYPASLNKVPLMIAYFSWAEETDFNLNNRGIYFSPGHDENTQQEIQPKNPIQPGRSYSASELIDSMIRDSDNNATLLLLNDIDQGTLGKTFSDLNVPFLAPGQAPKNYMTVSQYAFFFRILYSGWVYL